MTGFSIEHKGATAWLTIDRPKANAIDAATSLALGTAIRELDSDPAVRVIVITGAGERFFCAGWDLKAAAAGEAPDADFGSGGFAGLTELHDRSTPVIAAVNGLALGGGAELALAADLIVAADHAEFGLPEARLGIVADSGGFIRLPRALPERIAIEMLLTGSRLCAADALRWGMVNHVVPLGQLHQVTDELAQTITRSAPLSVAATLEVTEGLRGLSASDAFARMRSGSFRHYPRVLSSEDADEGIAAFAEGRDPAWKGR